MTSHQFFHEVTIACATEVVFDYITEPACWREWFSASLPTAQDINAQRTGEQFRMVTVQRPATTIPFSLKHTVTCRVCKCDRPYLWEVAAESKLVEAITSYTLSHAEEGTILKRHFRYTPRSWLRYAEPIFRRRIREQAQASLANLKAALEKRC